MAECKECGVAIAQSNAVQGLCLLCADNRFAGTKLEVKRLLSTLKDINGLVQAQFARHSLLPNLTIENTRLKKALEKARSYVTGYKAGSEKNLAWFDEALKEPE